MGIMEKKMAMNPVVAHNTSMLLVPPVPTNHE